MTKSTQAGRIHDLKDTDTLLHVTSWYQPCKMKLDELLKHGYLLKVTSNYF